MESVDVGAWDHFLPNKSVRGGENHKRESVGVLIKLKKDKEAGEAGDITYYVYLKENCIKIFYNVYHRKKTMWVIWKL